MEGVYDAIATEDLINATEEAEHAYSAATQAGDWKTTLDDLVVKPPMSWEGKSIRGKSRNYNK